MDTLVEGFDAVYRADGYAGLQGSEFPRDEAHLGRRFGAACPAEVVYYGNRISGRQEAGWNNASMPDNEVVFGDLTYSTNSFLLGPASTDFRAPDPCQGQWSGTKWVVQQFHHPVGYFSGFADDFAPSHSSDLGSGNCALPSASTFVKPPGVCQPPPSPQELPPYASFPAPLDSRSLVGTGGQHPPTWDGGQADVEKAANPRLFRKRKRKNVDKTTSFPRRGVLKMTSLDPSSHHSSSSPYAASSSSSPSFAHAQSSSPSSSYSGGGHPQAASLSSSSASSFSSSSLKWEQRQAANVRERKRMRTMNAAFDGLRSRIPMTATATAAAATGSKKPTKVDILRLAIHYIRQLTSFIRNYDVIEPHVAAAEMRHYDVITGGDDDVIDDVIEYRTIEGFRSAGGEENQFHDQRTNKGQSEETLNV